MMPARADVVLARTHETSLLQKQARGRYVAVRNEEIDVLGVPGVTMCGKAPAANQQETNLPALLRAIQVIGDLLHTCILH